MRDATGREEQYDDIVFACHGDQILPLLLDATPDERRVLGGMRYKANHAIVHRDVRQMPRLRSCWSSWNYLAQGDSETRQLALTYWMNRLQPFIGQGDDKNIFITLNPLTPIPKELVLREFHYEHPIYTPEVLEC